MEKTEIPAVSKYFIKKGMKACRLSEHIGRLCSFIFKWTRKFKFGQEILDDDPHTGRPKSATNSDFIAKGHGGLSTGSVRDCWSCRYVIWMGISHFNWRIGFEKIIHKMGRKLNRVEMFEHSLTSFQRNKQDFLRQFVTTEETWVHSYTPEVKQQPKL